jgi:hypothetical protein
MLTIRQDQLQTLSEVMLKQFENNSPSQNLECGDRS